MIIRRLIIGSTIESDEQRWAKPAQLICPACREPVRAQPGYWRMTDGPVPAWSHEDGEALCRC